ncbi:hypothetical protein TPA0907_43170 [Micromonospora humidisoli]|nr:hypothetical protein TPA0907_43170 [Micromonospora sp. AKA109]
MAVRPSWVARACATVDVAAADADVAATATGTARVTAAVSTVTSRPVRGRMLLFISMPGDVIGRNPPGGRSPR